MFEELFEFPQTGSVKHSQKQLGGPKKPRRGVPWNCAVFFHVRRDRVDALIADFIPPGL